MLSAFKNFGVTFLIAALLFGVIAYFATGFVTGTVENILDDEKEELDQIMHDNETETKPDEEESNMISGTDDDVPDGESFNFLVLTTDYRPDLYNTYRPSLDLMYNTDWYSVPKEETTGLLSGDYRKLNLTSIMLVRIDKENRQVIYSYFTPKTRVYTSTGYHDLSEVYNLYGKETVTDYINSLTGLKFKYTLLINGYNIDELTDLLGNVQVTSTRDIYHDGKYPTMQFETMIEHTSSDGSKWIEHIPNTYLQSAGEIQLDADKLYTMTSVIERSGSELSAKSAYMIEILQKYLLTISAMEEDAQKILLAQLITKEADWRNIEGVEYVDETVAESAEAYMDSDNTVSEDTVEKEFEPSDRWTADLFEPDNPIVETNYTMNDYDNIGELIKAISYFDPVVVTYPFEYKSATEDDEAYFSANTNEGLDLFMSYRLITKEDETLNLPN